MISVVSSTTIPSVTPLEEQSVKLSLKKAVEQVVIKIITLFKAIVEWLKIVCLTVQYYLCHLETRLASSERTHLFQGETCAPLSGNHGKKEDISLFLDPTVKTPPILKEKSKDYGVVFESEYLTLNPFGHGVCWGASVLFCKRWLSTKNIAAVSQEFEKGCPYEAVLLQSAYEELIESGEHWYDTDLNNVLQALIDAAKTPPSEIPLDRYLSSEVETILKSHQKESNANYRLLMYATCIFLTTNPRPNSYFNFIVEELGKVNISIKGIYYSTIRKVNRTLENKEHDRQLHWDLSNTACLIADCRLEKQILFDASATTLLDTIEKLPYGAYIVRVPVYCCLGFQVGAHAITLIKDTYQSYLFDSNLAAGNDKDKEGLAPLTKRAVKNYCGDCFDEERTRLQKVLQGLKRIGNFFLLNPNPPLIGEIAHTFDLYQVKLC